MSVELITEDLLDDVSNEARDSDRLRKNYNFHEANEDPCHRLLNAVEPGTYVMPHCHRDCDETMIIVRGKMGVVFFDSDGSVIQHALLEPNTHNVGVTIPKGVFHSLVAVETGTVFFESKAGPYRPLADNEIGRFAPEPQETQAANNFLETMLTLFYP